MPIQREGEQRGCEGGLRDNWSQPPHVHTHLKPRCQTVPGFREGQLMAAGSEMQTVLFRLACSWGS